MATYSDDEQRRLDRESGDQLDRHSARDNVVHLALQGAKMRRRREEYRSELAVRSLAFLFTPRELQALKAKLAQRKDYRDYVLWGMLNDASLGDYRDNPSGPIDHER